LAATRKRTLRSVSARSARSVWSKCQSRVIESRNFADRQGLPACAREGSTAMHEISRHRNGAQARCVEAGPGSENRAEAYGGILESWESRTVPTETRRIRTTPAHQRPGAAAAVPAAEASESSGTRWEPASEGNRSARDGGGGSRSGLIVAFESRVTSRREPASSEGGRRGEVSGIGPDVGEILPQSNVSTSSWHIASVSETSPRRTGCVNCARPGPWGCRRDNRRHYPAKAQKSEFRFTPS
jgi:hypothetical protein